MTLTLVNPNTGGIIHRQEKFTDEAAAKLADVFESGTNFKLDVNLDDGTHRFLSRLLVQDEISGEVLVTVVKELPI